jgi:Protein of unknown function (DUF3591)
MALSSSVPQLDFEALLSRKFSPSQVARLVPREKYHPHLHHQRSAATDSSSSSAAAEHRRKKRAEQSATAATTTATTTAALIDPMRQETSRLVLSLVSQTPNFLRHLPEGVDRNSNAARAWKLAKPRPPPLASSSSDGAVAEAQRIPSKFHEVELGDWESKIDWGDDIVSSSNGNEPKQPRPALPPPLDPMELLQKKRNPFLDSLVFDESTICWDGTDVEKLLEKSRNAPLILELGVAGRSVARHVYQNTVLSAQRPMPALKSDEYTRRVERDWSAQPITSTAGVSASAVTQMATTKGSLHADKDKMEALIEARQNKRAEMAKDKTSRVTQAMGTLALGGGRGRTITSSLMGPGGTERTGRPSRQNVGLAGYENEYIEQLDLVNSHALVRDLSKIMLREFHRPKLPRSVVRLDLAWQFQIRYLPAKKADGQAGAAGSAAGGGVGGMVAGYMGGGAHPGAVSKTRLRAEADLSPTEGNLILVEYCEERPILQLGKAMAFKIVNYYRGDKSRCPVSKGGGDRPARRKRPGETDGDSRHRTAANRNDMARLDGPKETNVMDWVGELPKRKPKDRAEKEAIDILPEGVTEILHPKGTTFLHFYCGCYLLVFVAVNSR